MSDFGGGGGRGGRDFGRDGGRDRPRSAEGRVPPHNLSAEESLLGALLLSRDVVGQVAELGLLVDHFYKPSHQHIYSAIRGLMAAGNAVDIVTVADELRRNGLLDEVGGSQALLELQNATPAISNAARYAKIVQDTAVLRRLISVAGEITELAYLEPDDVTKALDEAETKVFEVAEDRVVDSTRALGDLLPLAMDKLQETFERGDSITGAATGYNDLDEILSGLQPSTLNIIGARPAMGKCVAWDTPIIDPRTGAMRTAAELFDASLLMREVPLVSLADDASLVESVVSVLIDDGIKPLFRVETASGRHIRITAPHPLLSQHGWRPLEQLAAGDFIAAPAILPIFGSSPLAESVEAVAERSLREGAVDSSVFTAPEAEVRQFLEVLFGAPLESAHGRRRSFPAAMADEVAHLLLRCGVGCVRRASARGVSLRVAAAPRSLPMEAWDDVIKAKGERTWASINAMLGKPAGHQWHAYRRRLDQPTVAELAEVLDDDRLRWWASPAVTWDRIVSISPAGVDRVIDFTVPQLHNFVAADLYVHNTAVGLGIATNVAKLTQKPVLIFSLEMGHAELTQRILSSEAEVESQKLRSGRLVEADWTKIGRAINRIDTLPLYLDDNPRVTVMEIRAKARRIKARHGGLALIMIDYLQLMSGGASSENRQLEVSEISRGLKILARELDVPIIALSQLSRNLESRADKRPMLADLRESGCLTADTQLVRADTNQPVTLGELVAQGARDVPVWSLDEHYRLVEGTVTNAFSSGVKQVFRLRFASGRLIEASGNHPFLTLDGWVRVDEMKVGDRFASARRLPGGAAACDAPEADDVPAEVWQHVQYKSLPAAGITNDGLAAALGLPVIEPAMFESTASRDQVGRVAAATDDPWLADLATSDVLWDKLVEIEPLGEIEVFDATVEPHHNFVANGLVAHNSLEQDADVVMFLYRDEVYNRDSPDKASAELIIAKHRSGPTGVARLVWRGQYTKFGNAARNV
jgi:replicative DNA helicase